MRRAEVPPVQLIRPRHLSPPGRLQVDSTGVTAATIEAARTLCTSAVHSMPSACTESALVINQQADTA